MVDEPNHALLSILTYGIKGKYLSQVQQVHRSLFSIQLCVVLPLCCSQRELPEMSRRI